MEQNSVEKGERVPTFEELLQAAKEERWEFVDKHLTDEGITQENFDWARDVLIGRLEDDDNVRDFAATVLMTSSKATNTYDETLLLVTMARDGYNIVQYRLAMALYKRGNRSQPVIGLMNEAASNPDVGELAKKYLAA